VKKTAGVRLPRVSVTRVRPLALIGSTTKQWCYDTGRVNPAYFTRQRSSSTRRAQPPHRRGTPLLPAALGSNGMRTHVIVVPSACFADDLTAIARNRRRPRFRFLLLSRPHEHFSRVPTPRIGANTESRPTPVAYADEENVLSLTRRLDNEVSAIPASNGPACPIVNLAHCACSAPTAAGHFASALAPRLCGGTTPSRHLKKAADTIT
jgi:hypothetical protein